MNCLNPICLVLCFLVSASFADYAEQAEQILSATQIQGGFIVHLGAGDGKLTSALRINDRYQVHGLDTNRKNVQRGRQHVREAGVTGRGGAGCTARLDHLRAALLHTRDELPGKMFFHSFLREPKIVNTSD